MKKSLGILVITMILTCGHAYALTRTVQGTVSLKPRVTDKNIRNFKFNRIKEVNKLKDGISLTLSDKTNIFLPLTHPLAQLGETGLKVLSQAFDLSIDDITRNPGHIMSETIIEKILEELNSVQPEVDPDVIRRLTENYGDLNSDLSNYLAQGQYDISYDMSWVIGSMSDIVGMKAIYDMIASQVLGAGHTSQTQTWSGRLGTHTETTYYYNNKAYGGSWTATNNDGSSGGGWWHDNNGNGTHDEGDSSGGDDDSAWENFWDWVLGEQDEDDEDKDDENCPDGDCAGDGNEEDDDDSIFAENEGPYMITSALIEELLRGQHDEIADLVDNYYNQFVVFEKTDLKPAMGQQQALATFKKGLEQILSKGLSTIEFPMGIAVEKITVKAVQTRQF